MKILIAEDQVPSALFLRRTLERMGHDVTVAHNGLEAWEVASKGSVSLLISDWMMPHMDGPELCRRIRQKTEGGYTYVILLTSKDRRQDRLEGLRAGADDFLTKPPDPEELAVRLEIAGRILAVHDELGRQNEKLAEMAAFDELTGIKNRRRFREDMEIHFALSTRQAAPISLVMLDVDHFKQYNDSFGHPAGDEVLRTVANALRDGTREQDLVARYGGEEFIVLLPTTGVQKAMVVAERIRERIEQQPWTLRKVTASLGVATTDYQIGNSTALIDAADQALYQAKRSGRNRVHHHQMPAEPLATSC